MKEEENKEEIYTEEAVIKDANDIRSAVEGGSHLHLVWSLFSMQRDHKILAKLYSSMTPFGVTEQFVSSSFS